MTGNEHVQCVYLEDARDKPLIDVSSARGLNEPGSGAVLTSDRVAEQTRRSWSLLRTSPPPPSPSLSLSLLSLSPTIIHPYASFGYLERVTPPGSIHPSHVTSAVVPSGSCVYRHDAWLKGSQQRSSSCQTQRGRRLEKSSRLGACLCVMDLLLPSEKSWIS